MWQETAQPLFQYYHIYLDSRQELKIHRWHSATQQLNSGVGLCHL